MVEITKETVVTPDESTETVLNNPTGRESTPVMATQVKTAATSSETFEYLVYFFFGALDILLSFRLVLKLMGASVSSTFVSFIYGLTGLFIAPFEGIFRRGISEGIETTSVLEPATVVAIIVYSLLAWGIVRLIRIFSGTQQRTE
jgi:hypothetical protein